MILPKGQMLDQCASNEHGRMTSETDKSAHEDKLAYRENVSLT